MKLVQRHVRSSRRLMCPSCFNVFEVEDGDFAIYPKPIVNYYNLQTAFGPLAYPSMSYDADSLEETLHFYCPECKSEQVAPIYNLKVEHIYENVQDP